MTKGAKMLSLLLLALCSLGIPLNQARYLSNNHNSSTAKFPDEEFVIRQRQRENGLEDKPYGYGMHLSYCRKKAKCELLNYSMCMGAKLPYTSTSLELTDLQTQEKIQEKLNVYQHLRYIPKCWAVIQPFLCALYMPKCEDGLVDMPSKEMCKITLAPCRIFYNSSIFPSFLDCDDERLFPSKCKNDVHELKFNTTGYCMDPLVKSDNPDWFYSDIEGCGLRCRDSLYTENEHYQIHKLTAYCVPICMFFILFTIMTFIIGWDTANKYPTLAIFYINICFLIACSGLAIQFLGSESREDIVCKKDGTLRKSEPSASENLSCVIVFVMVYYFLIAGLVWCVIFSYAWQMSSLQALGKTQERVDKKRAYFHLIAWSLPLILTITTMALGQIDGDYVTGVCFVGMVSFEARIGLFLAPLTVAIVIASSINFRTIFLLLKVTRDSREVISEHSNRKIRSNIVRMGVFTLFLIVFFIITFIYHVYIWHNTEVWNASLHSYILCKLTSLSSDFSHCKQDARPSVAMLQLQLLAIVGTAIAMASWVWCDSTWHSWERYIRKKFRCEVEEQMKFQKHKIIAQAFAKRKKFNEGGRISIDCQNYTDPVGLHFDLNSATSNGLSTTWAANLPRFVNRRGAMVEMAYSVSSNNQSIDSEVSFNVKHVSIESRCNSGDSQLSVQIAELKARRKVNTRRHGRHHRHHKDFRRGSHDRHGASSRRTRSRTSRTQHHHHNRASSSSLDSHLHLLNVLTNTSNVASMVPNMKRRTANAGLDGQHINKLLSNGKLVIPYNMNGIPKSETENEDENVSVTISESKYNMVISNTNNLDLNDQLVMKSLRRGLHIEELNSTDSEDDKRSQKTKMFVSENCFGRDSKQSRRSKRSKASSIGRAKYSSNTDSDIDVENHNSDSSSCPEIQKLLNNSET